MKKVFTISLLVLFSVATFGQDAKSSDMKNFRFGVTALPSFMWYKPDDLKKFENRGAAFKFGVLINAEYSFSGNFAIGFGIGLGSCGGKINFLDDSIYYYFNDGEVIPLAEGGGPPNLSNITGKVDTLFLKTRTYKGSYYCIPVSLKMRTNEIGYMRYFIEPRFNIGIRKKVRADDDVVNFSSSSGSSIVPNSDIDITKDMATFKTSITISGGGEYYLSGSTAFVFAIGYDYGLSNAVQKTSGNVLRTKDGSTKALEQKFAQNGLIVSLGILF